MGIPQVIYAEVTSKQLRQIEIDGELQFCFPEGVKMARKWGSKGFTLTCNNEHVAGILVEGLDDTGLSWQTVEEFPKSEQTEQIEEPKWYKRKESF